MAKPTVKCELIQGDGIKLELSNFEDYPVIMFEFVAKTFNCSLEGQHLESHCVFWPHYTLSYEDCVDIKGCIYRIFSFLSNLSDSQLESALKFIEVCHLNWWSIEKINDLLKAHNSNTKGKK